MAIPEILVYIRRFCVEEAVSGSKTIAQVIAFDTAYTS